MMGAFLMKPGRGDPRACGDDMNGWLLGKPAGLLSNFPFERGGFSLPSEGASMYVTDGSAGRLVVCRMSERIGSGVAAL